MDTNYIKFLLTGQTEPDKLLQNGDIIPVEITELMKHATNQQNKSIFIPPKRSTIHPRYSLLVKCDCCNKIVKTNLMYMSAIIRFFNNLTNNEFVCVDCSSDFKTSQLDQIKNISKVTQYNDIVDWEVFREKVLQPVQEGGFNPKAIFCRHSYDDKIKEYILSMKYEDFLETPYWRTIRGLKISKSKSKCNLCGSSKCLNVHHAKYDRHGQEHLYDVFTNDLIVLCRNCHEKFHGIKPVSTWEQEDPDTWEI